VLSEILEAVDRGDFAAFMVPVVQLTLLLSLDA
jgi:hypothetical protein